MKRIRCPKCKESFVFDETKCEAGQKVTFQCPHCEQSFTIRLGNIYGYITVIENVFHYQQDIPLQLGVNKIGRYQKSNPINIPLATDDPSIDLLHCTITVSRDKHSKLKYVLKDGPSFTGTFVDNDILGDNEQRVITDGQLFTIGATSIILHTPESTSK